MEDDKIGSPQPSRRRFLLTTGTTLAASVLAVHTPAQVLAHETETASSGDASAVEGAIAITLRINGKDHQLRIDPRTTLLDCIRESVDQCEVGGPYQDRKSTRLNSSHT